MAGTLLEILVRLPQGRPIGWILPFLFSGLTIPVGGLPLAYLAAWGIATLNALLCFLLFRRIGSPTLGLVGALAFALYPADTTHPYLMHEFGLYPAQTFLLLALIVYFSPKRGYAYLVILGALLTYESAFLPFIGAPLLDARWDRRWAARFFWHVLILSVMLAGMFVVRRWLGEGRVMTEFMDPGGTIVKTLAALVLGPIVALGAFPLRAALVWTRLFTQLAIVLAILFVALAFGLHRIIEQRVTPLMPQSRKTFWERGRELAARRTCDRVWRRWRFWRSDMVCRLRTFLRPSWRGDSLRFIWGGRWAGRCLWAGLE